jgi:alpha-L-rhamnosidase
MWRHIAGLNPDDDQPGWKHFTIEPRPGGGVTWARAEYGSIRGRIASAWRLADGRFELDVTVPPNTTGTVVLSASSADAIAVGGKPISEVAHVKLIRSEAGRAWVQVEPGTYAFRVQNGR